MKARLVPLYFDPGRDERFRQDARRPPYAAGRARGVPRTRAAGRPAARSRRRDLPAAAGRSLPAGGRLSRHRVPILLVTSEFGTLSMWDWEIAEYLRSQRRPDDRPLQSGADEEGLRGSGRQTRTAGRPNSWSTRTIRAKASRRRSSNASTGGKTSARQRLADKFGITDRQEELSRAGRGGESDPGRPGRRHVAALASCRPPV